MYVLQSSSLKGQFLPSFIVVVVLARDWLQVEKAESVLLEIKRLIDKRTDVTSEQFVTDVTRLSDEFYVHLPHNNKHRAVIASKQLIASKQQLCQVYIYAALITTLIAGIGIVESASRKQRLLHQESGGG